MRHQAGYQWKNDYLEYQLEIFGVLLRIFQLPLGNTRTPGWEPLV